MNDGKVDKRENVKLKSDREIAIRLLKNLQNRCRASGTVEVSMWSLQDVLNLMSKWQPPDAVADAMKQGFQPRLRVLRVDPDKPFLPNNARVAMFGER